MRIVKPMPPQELKLHVPWQTLCDLKLYQRYQKEIHGSKWDLKEMVAAILTLFLAEGDPDFLAWRKRIGHAAEKSLTPFVDANGAPDA